MKSPRILVVHLRSTYTRLVSDKKRSGALKLIESEDPLVENIVAAHQRHIASMDKVKTELQKRGLVSTWRNRISDIDPNEFDLVVTVGGDGTVLHASHSIGSTPVLGVNSSPSTSVGFFTGANADDFGEAIDKVLAGELSPITLCRMEVQVNGEVVTKRALNDVLFCHDCPASTTRYVLTFDGKAEDQLSSGVWVCTAAGSTAAIRSAGGRTMPSGSKRLQFAVREPFAQGGPGERKPIKLVRGFISHNETLTIRSKTEAARLYIDGPHVVFPVDFGDFVVFSRSDEPLNLFGYNKKDE
jgi:NAD+ kinase